MSVEKNIENEPEEIVLENIEKNKVISISIKNV